MASSGSFNTSKYSGGYGTCGLNVSWTITSQSIADNTSTVKWTVKSNGTMSSGYWYYCFGVEVTINGTKVLNTSTKFEMKGSGGYKRSGTIVIAHNADGTKTVSMSARAKIYQNSWNCTGSASPSPSLDRINRYALLGEVPNFTDEESPTVPFSNPAGTNLVTDLKLRMMWNSDNDATSYVDIPEADWGGGTIVLDLDAYRTSLRNSCPSSNTLAVKYDLMSTMGGVQYHDYKTAVMNIVNADPTSGAVTYQDTDAGVIAITGDYSVIVQLHSTLRINTATSTGNKGASIASYKLTFNGNDYIPDGSGNVDFVKPDLAGTFPAVVTTTDSRGNTSTASVNVPISGWTKPSALYSFARVADFVTNDAVLHVDGAISTVTGSTMQITESHSEKGSGIWSAPATIADDTDETIHYLDYRKEYELKIEVSDSFTRADSPPTNTEYTTGISKGIPLMYPDVFNHSVGINGIPDEQNQLFVGGTEKLKPNDTDAGVILPHSYSTTEKIVGYWTDGRPIYEKTVVLGSTVNVAAGNTSAGGTWTLLDSGWTNVVRILDFKAYHEDSGGCVLWSHLTANWNNNAINVLNIRSVSLSIERFTIQYIYGTFS